MDYAEADAADRREAASLAVSRPDACAFASFEETADRIYSWLRARPTVKPARLVLTAGPVKDQPAGGKVALELDMTDVQQDTFTVAATDSKGFPVPDGPYTWTEDSGGSVITLVDNGDGSATASAVAPGQATLTVTDQSGVSGSELVVVTPGPVASIGIVAGTPGAEPTPAP